jgi:hypothetical protein
MKVIIFDASTLISFAMACMYEELKKLKQNFDGHFIITQDVKKEIIDKPMKVPRFQLEAMKINELLKEKILELPDILGINEIKIKNSTNKTMNLVNSTFFDNKGYIKLISEGEASCIALSKILNEKKISNVVAIDERIMRSFCETPEKLKEHLEKKMHTKIKIKKENLNLFKKFNIIRSVELAYIAYKKRLIEIRGKNVLISMINALRYKGCSISNEDIEEIKKMK